MNQWDIDQIAKATGGKIISSIQKNVLGFGTDTRTDLTGRLFIALRGENFDAHQFLNLAIEKNSACLLVDKEEVITNEIRKKVSVILVSDTLKALQDFAQWHRRQWKGYMLGITGSNGKTSTKEFMAQVIQVAKSVYYSQGSFNNHWGVPFSLLHLEPKHEVALIEIGMNHPGEITQLVHLAEPNAVVCTMVGRAHIEFFGTIEKIAEVKEETYLAAQPEVTRIYNLDNVFTRKMFERGVQAWPKGRRLSFSEKESSADVNLTVTEMTLTKTRLTGKILDKANSVTVPVFGKQNLTNLMAAATGALAAGLTADQVWSGLANCRTVWGRNQLLQTKLQAQVIFDGYNANPDSMKALLENVQGLKGFNQKTGVFGQMLEMGELSEKLHEELGFLVGKTNFDLVFFYGNDFQAFEKGYKNSGCRGKIFIQNEYSDDFAEKLSKSVLPNDLVVFKGSRGMKLERMLKPLQPIGFEEKK